eukprot:m.162364 g.162364  ORF g.162364 m.162364 type:complete len:430 (+) comp10298_c5_seq4:1900-3189(+)
MQVVVCRSPQALFGCMAAPAWLAAPAARPLAERVHIERTVPSLVERSGTIIQAADPAAAAAAVAASTQQRLQQDEAALQRFQHSVKRRVAQHGALRAKVLQGISRETLDKERRVLHQVQFLEPSKIALSKRASQRPAPPDSNAVTAIRVDQEAARAGLCSRKMDPKLASELPGGLWSRDQAFDEALAADDRRRSMDLGALPEQSSMARRARQRDATSAASRARPSRKAVRVHTAAIHADGVTQEELARQSKALYGLCRRVFMEQERAQVREIRRGRQHDERSHRLKDFKERQRTAAEELVGGASTGSRGTGTSASTSRPRSVGFADEEVTAVRGAQALRRPRTTASVSFSLPHEQQAEMAEQPSRPRRKSSGERLTHLKDLCARRGITLPPLCSCGPPFAAHHRNNCEFYRRDREFVDTVADMMRFYEE